MSSKSSLIKLSVIVFALTATPKLWSETLASNPAFAQSPTPTSFPLPTSLPSGTAIKVDGSTSMAVVNEALKQRFQQQFAGSTVELAANGSDQAIEALKQGEIALAAIGRPLSDAEKAEGLIEVPIKREKVAIIVSPDNPFDGNITFAQFSQIFRGEITDWSELGGQPGPIRFIDRPDFSDTRQALSNYEVFKGAPFETGSNTTQMATDETDAILSELGRDGISYAIADQVLNQSNVKIIQMHRTLPDDPRYPFSQPRGFVYKEGSNPAVQAFLGFVTSPGGQAAITAAPTAGLLGAAAAGSTASPSPSPSPIESPSPAAVASPAPPEPAATDSPVAQAPATTTPETADRGGLSPWWLLALLPLLGGLIWWFRGRGAGTPAVGGAAVAPVPVAPIPPPVATADPRIILTPRDCRHAYAYWEVTPEQRASIREQGGQKLGLRLYDVTDIDIDTQIPHSVKSFDCRETDADLQVPIPVDNRDYLAELGYVTAEGRWLKVARSAQVRVPACPVESAPVPSVPETQVRATPAINVNPGGVAAGAAALGGVLAGAAALGRSSESTPTPTPIAPQSRMLLTPRDGQNAYAYWETPDVEKAALKQQGGQQLVLRLHDITGLDPDQLLPPAIQQLNCADLDQDRHLVLPATDRDYVAEVGYLTGDGQWLKLARSNAVRVVPPISPDPTTVVGANSMGSPEMGNLGAGLGVGAGIAAGTIGMARSITSDSRPAEMERRSLSEADQPDRNRMGEISESVGSAPGSCSIKNLAVHAKHHCCLLDEFQMHKLQTQTAVSHRLAPGTHIVRLKAGGFGYQAEHQEPIVMLWISGGKVINGKTNVPVNATWSTLNGYDETLTLEVQETSTLHAFFFDTHPDDNDGEVTLTVISLPSRPS